jgi:hypothetical protein
MALVTSASELLEKYAALPLTTTMRVVLAPSPVVNVCADCSAKRAIETYSDTFVTTSTRSFVLSST